ncbi:unnamed protein product [Camellia sinensis]
MWENTKAECLYDDGKNQVKQGQSIVDSSIFRSFVDSQIQQNTVPKLEDFLGGESNFSGPYRLRSRLALDMSAFYRVRVWLRRSLKDFLVCSPRPIGGIRRGVEEDVVGGEAGDGESEGSGVVGSEILPAVVTILNRTSSFLTCLDVVDTAIRDEKPASIAFGSVSELARRYSLCNSGGGGNCGGGEVMRSRGEKERWKFLCDIWVWELRDLRHYKIKLWISSITKYGRGTLD